MKCDVCDAVATVHVIEIHNGKKVEKHLCEKHAAEEGLPVKVSQKPLDQLLEKFVLKHTHEQPDKTVEQRCEFCGMTYSEFRRTGLLGCAGCYETFDPILKPLVQRAHLGGNRHVGKIPVRAGADQLRQHRLTQLRRELDDAVTNEEYERAAQLRDELNTLQESVE